jgi:hypothetical protein
MVKIYQLYGIETAMQMLRPNARWEITNSVITKWEDYREKPTWEEIQETMNKIKAFEDSIDTVWTPAQIKEYTGQEK